LSLEDIWNLILIFEEKISISFSFIRQFGNPSIPNFHFRKIQNPNSQTMADPEADRQRAENQDAIKRAQRGALNIIFSTLTAGSNIRDIRLWGVQQLKRNVTQDGYECSRIIKVYEDMAHCRAHKLTPLTKLWEDQQPENWKDGYLRGSTTTLLEIPLEDLSKRKLLTIDGMHRVHAMNELLQEWCQEQDPAPTTFQEFSECPYYSSSCGWLYDVSEIGALVNLLARQSNASTRHSLRLRIWTKSR
jgi:hypothetical protein